MIETSAIPGVIPQRVPLASDEPQTLPEVYERVARDHPKPDTLNYKRDGAWHSISAAEMLQRAKHIALGLNSLGIGKGERVALLSESCAEWVLTDQGCLFAGAITVPIYPTLTPTQAQYILKDSGARVLFVQSREKLAQMEDVLRDSPEISHVVLFEEEAPGRPNTWSLSDLGNKGRDLEKEKPSLIEELARGAKPEDLATIIYTSGTTGEPKGVMLSHSNMVSNLIDSSNHFEFGEEDTALSVLP
ncbi:MAG TPA: AMP-binding protein, partial [Pyrinomonadaceae bacterium]|nr:AMP-binding protein [Pyrinomonadaceae bacterium]